MSLKDLHLQKMYRTKKCNIVNEFYVPVLNQAVEYKRAVGFFSSSALYEIASGIIGLVGNGGYIQLIVSPRLTAEDAIAIKEGYDRREIIEKRIIEDFTEPTAQRNKNQLNLLSNLIAEGKLDIKVAFMADDELYHEKIGIVKDIEGNVIAFNGSNNETYNAFCKNFESFLVFDNWSNEENKERSRIIEKSFDDLWLDLDETVDVLPFPKVAVKKLEKYKEYSTEQVISIEKEFRKTDNANPFFVAPSNISFYDYQEEAVSNWMDNHAVGIFDMATGSGKTFTALYGLSELSIKLQNRLAVVIVVPYQHLVEQWVEDIEAFNVEPIIAYSAYPKWEEFFSDAVDAYNLKVRRNFCVITTIGTFSTNRFQNVMKRIRNRLCFVADEAHNMGAANVSTLLPENAKYRLALSATIERHRDPSGTEVLKNYFGEICQSFTLKDAIDRGFLTPYYYHPVLCELTENELKEYKKLTERIAKLGGASEENIENNPVIELLLLKRARILSGAINKFSVLLELISKYKDDSHILVYCGATKYDREDIEDDTEEKQIVVITRALYEKYGFKVRKFTSAEGKQERTEIKNLFKNGDIQVVTAIKCLDEGVNIPAIRTAFIMASSTNPKEYIQRRGRVLRKAEGKEYAEIFDFVTIPRALDKIERFIDEDQKRMELSLLKKEISRMEDFAKTAKNPAETMSIIDSILNAYHAFDIDVRGEICDE